ncbi:ATP synthase F1 subcomplex gamma subunit [Actinokineospora alba]|uniref:ATP synthase gamma chain n=1 Tax=Actinokineospora alba TaxID=504798 RepID=A0A1H0HJ92_9PSEU|nr:F0F1 ATP synthase subunit gamma [Actinokineospora alba]TDP64862.1 ATP synthase F1 subcomplex gamma subunit [Actinokineospora alba]SDH47769.1 F-type H+-transporting ATPase subunit gamma [Actinokineospora alba]SDO19276.1 ATP synthase F1 subcomplex gamma subunit [Actinokineospora alba]
MAQLREIRQRIKSAQSFKKIFKAQELIATSRISKAQARVAQSKPYADEITHVLTALAGAAANLDSPLLVERSTAKRAGVLLITSDRGLCGGYNANAIKAAEELQALLREQGKTPVLFVIGRKGLNFYRFRQRPVAQSWTGFSEKPSYVNAAEAGETLIDAFLAGADDEGDNAGADGILGVDELHVVYTEFVSMLTQRPVAKRVAPLEVEYSSEEEAAAARAELKSAYAFEPSAETLLGNLLPKYINTRIYAALLESAASESAARRTAMKAATDNADELVKSFTRVANQVRQAQITQEISEIVGGVEALAAAAGSDD